MVSVEKYLLDEGIKFKSGISEGQMGGDPSHIPAHTSPAAAAPFRA